MRTTRCKFARTCRDHVCEAGVDRRALVGGPDFGWYVRTPCDLEHDASATCNARQFPTAEEVEAFDRMIEERIKLHEKIEPTVAEIKRNHKGKCGRGSIPCPACKDGRVEWAIASNGHLRMHCSTRGCLAFME